MELRLKALFTPARRVIPGKLVEPAYVLVPEKVRLVPARPEIRRSLPARPETAPATAREEPFSPVPAMLQVWSAPRTIGALMRMAPALSSIVMPSAGLAGATVRA